MFRFGLLTHHRHTDPEPTAAERYWTDPVAPGELTNADTLRVYADVVALRQASLQSDADIGLALVATGIHRNRLLDDIAIGQGQICDRISSLIDAVRDRP